MDYEKIAYSFSVDLSTIIWMMYAKDCQGPTYGQLGLIRSGDFFKKLLEQGSNPYIQLFNGFKGRYKYVYYI